MRYCPNAASLAVKYPMGGRVHLPKRASGAVLAFSPANPDGAGEGGGQKGRLAGGLPSWRGVLHVGYS